MNDKPPDKKPSWFSGLLSRLLSKPAAEHPDRSGGNPEQAGRPVAPESTSMVSDKLDQKQVRDIMVPRSEVVFAYVDESADEVLDRVIDSGFTRLPVADKDEQKVLGVLHAKDLLQYLKENGSAREQSLTGLMRTVKAAPESMRISALLEDFKRKRLHMAPVVDEYGGIAGIVTIEDVLEEIVGEIEDEHDKREDVKKIRQVADGSWDIQANIPLSEFNTFFGTGWSSKDADTLGGLVVEQFGHIPRRGEHLEYEGFAFRVKSVYRGRIRQLSVRSVEVRSVAAG